MFLLNRRDARALTSKIGIALCAVAAQLIFSATSSAVPGDLYVSDLATNSIVIYHEDGTSSTFATGLNSPQGVTFDQAHNLFVADSGSGNVFKFTPDGTKSTFASGFSNPVGVALHSPVGVPIFTSAPSTGHLRLKASRAIDAQATIGRGAGRGGYRFGAFSF